MKYEAGSSAGLGDVDYHMLAAMVLGLGLAVGRSLSCSAADLVAADVAAAVERADAPSMEVVVRCCPAEVVGSSVRRRNNLALPFWLSIWIYLNEIGTRQQAMFMY